MGFGVGVDVIFDNFLSQPHKIFDYIVSIEKMRLIIFIEGMVLIYDIL